VLEIEKAIETRQFVLRKTAARGGWDRISKKRKKERRNNSSDNKLEKKVIEVETESELNSEEDARRKGKKSTKKEVRTRKVQFDNKGKKEREELEQVDELTRKLL